MIGCIYSNVIPKNFNIGLPINTEEDPVIENTKNITIKSLGVSTFQRNINFFILKSFLQNYYWVDKNKLT